MTCPFTKQLAQCFTEEVSKVKNHNFLYTAKYTQEKTTTVPSKHFFAHMLASKKLATKIHFKLLGVIEKQLTHLLKEWLLSNKVEHLQIS